ncbi:MAG: HD domain-containing protein [Fretibacterium sp.]|nr:HD domain-containing protein [Fretibacterium sp.]
MIARTLLERVFSAASMERWNDHPHPAVFTELGKQAHKMAAAWVLGKCEEDRGESVDWEALIRGGIFEFLYRVVVTDIRPPVFHKLMQDPETKTRLDEWVASRLEPELSALPAGMGRAFREYHRSAGKTLEQRILSAAHYMATKWEFGFILHWSAGMYGIDRTRREVEANIAAITLPSARRMLDDPDGSPLWGFISMVGQLTFQKRWAQTPRMPSTSVLGHLLFVAVASWLLSHEIGASLQQGRLCPRRIYNNFFGGLFHDLPEVLTRDIISPVKASVEGLDDMIRRYEREAMEERILPLLPPHWHRELRWYTEEEFTNKTWHEGKDRIDPIERHEGDIPAALNKDRYSPYDGRLVELCDKLAAYLEASASISTGVRSTELESAKRQLYARFHSSCVCGLPLGYLFEYFR